MNVGIYSKDFVSKAIHIGSCVSYARGLRNGKLKMKEMRIEKGKLSGGSIEFRRFVNIYRRLILYLQGIQSSSASFLISIIGITNTVGRVFCGFIADLPWVDSLFLNNICLVVSSISVAATPFCQTYAQFIIMAIFFGIAICKYSFIFYLLASFFRFCDDFAEAENVSEFLFVQDFDDIYNIYNWVRTVRMYLRTSTYESGSTQWYKSRKE